MNNLGTAVGAAYDEGWNWIAAYSYSILPRTFRTLPAPTEVVEPQPFGINDLGFIVGGVYSPDYSTEYGYIQGTSGAYHLLWNPNAYSFTEARGINDQGFVVGWSDIDDGNSTAAFIYDPVKTTYTDSLPSEETIASGINSSGDVVGGSWLLADGVYSGSPEGWYAWRRTREGANFRVNGTDTDAQQINDQGLVLFRSHLSLWHGVRVSGRIGRKARVLPLRGHHDSREPAYVGALCATRDQRPWDRVWLRRGCGSKRTCRDVRGLEFGIGLC